MEFDENRKIKSRVAFTVTVIAVFCLIIALLVYFLGFFSQSKPYAVAVVLGAHRNSREVNLDPNSELELRIIKAVETNGYCSITIADGSPADQVKEFNYTKDTTSFLNRIIDPQQVALTNAERIKDIYAYLTSGKAKTPEVDLIAAISTAARQLHSIPGDIEREILVLGTGLSTTGFLNLAEGESKWLYEDTEVFVSYLTEMKNLPNLEGIKVIWCQIHDVDGIVQKEFAGVQKRNLELLWSKIIENSGGTFELSPAIPGQTIYNDPSLPYVSVCEVRPEVGPPLPPITPPPEDVPTPQVIEVMFKANSAEFIDKNQAKDAAKEWVKFIKNSNKGVFLFGCTAKTDSQKSDGYENHILLSQQRTDAVKRLLQEEFGIKSERIITKGLGYDNPWHKYNGEQGINWDESRAIENRKVVIMAQEDDYALKLYDGTRKDE